MVQAIGVAEVEKVIAEDRRLSCSLRINIYKYLTLLSKINHIVDNWAYNCIMRFIHILDFYNIEVN